MGTGGSFPFYESQELDCRIMALPYKENQSTMYIILPHNSNKQKLINLQNQLTSDHFENMIAQMQVRTSIVLFPKMHLTMQVNLRDTLLQLGVSSLFSPKQSDLSLISTPDDVTSGTVTNPLEGAQRSTITSGRVTNSPTSLSQLHPTNNLNDHLIFSRISPEHDAIHSLRKKRQVTYKAQRSKLGPDPLTLKDLVLKKRITKETAVEKKKHNRRNRRSTSEYSELLEKLERLRKTPSENPGLYADDVIHKVNLIVNEKGTEAGAATAVTINKSGPDVTFRVDGPFLMIIRHDETQIPLFYGPVFEPENV